MPTPEFLARQQIDSLLAACGWTGPDRGGINLSAARGVAIREFPVEGGFAADRQAAARVPVRGGGAEEGV